MFACKCVLLPPGDNTIAVNNKLTVLLWVLKHNGMSSIEVKNIVNWQAYTFYNFVLNFLVLKGEYFVVYFIGENVFSKIGYVSTTFTSRQYVILKKTWVFINRHVY